MKTNLGPFWRPRLKEARRALFEWDDTKADGNIAKHGVDFADAAKIFLDRYFEEEDKRRDYGEQRYRAIGRHGEEIFVVVYIVRGGHTRLISAWKGGKNDSEIYNEALARRLAESQGSDPRGRA